MDIRSMHGLGDNIYQRAFIRNLGARAPIRIDTPWPQLYEDLGYVQCLRSSSPLRTQRKNINRVHDSIYRPGSLGPHAVRIRHGADGIFRGMERCFGVPPLDAMDLPDFRDHNPHQGERYVVVRPVTVRREWRNESRNPLPEYVAQATVMALRDGVKVISVADLEPREEWIVGSPPVAHRSYHAGELSVRQLLGLVAGASLVIGGVGWIVPACMALNVDALIICGGNGGFNHPSLITDPRVDCRTLRFIMPDTFCKCREKQHDCNKTITAFSDRVGPYLDAVLGSRVLPREPNTL